MTTATIFETGRTYATRSACDHETVFRFAVIRRTAKTITFTYHGKEHTRGVKVYDGTEHCLPMGRFSMAPVISADKPEV